MHAASNPASPAHLFSCFSRWAISYRVEADAAEISEMS